MKWTRHRCQLAPESTLAMAAFSPMCESEITSCTPFSPRFTKDRRKAVQNASSSAGPTSVPRTLRSPAVLHPTATTLARETTRSASRTLW
jgi:hypothetical protein